MRPGASTATRYIALFAVVVWAAVIGVALEVYAHWSILPSAGLPAAIAVGAATYLVDR